MAKLEKGGAERQLQILVNNYDRDFFQMAILYIAEGSASPVIRNDVNLLKIGFNHKKNPLSYLSSINAKIREWKPDIVHLWLPEIITIPAALTSIFLKTPMLSAQRRSIRNSGSLLQWFRDRARYVHHILADQLVTNFNINYEPSFYRFLFKKKNGQVIPNSISLYEGELKSSYPSTLDNKDIFKIWFTGRFDSLKRIPLIIQAVAELKKQKYKVVLFICGKGSEEQTAIIKELILLNNLSDSVFLLGYRQDWHLLVQKTDLFVLPSVAEGMPNVMLEAMALKVPVLVSAIPEITSLVTHKETAYLFEPDRLDLLLDSFKEMYDNEELRTIIACNAQKYVAKFSCEAMITSYENIYVKLIKKTIP